MSRKLIKRSLLVLLLGTLVACGEADNTKQSDGGSDLNQSLKAESFQVFKRGENSPLQKLEVNNGDVIMLEARGSISEPLAWFSALPDVGSFEKAGELRIVGEARFLVGAYNSKSSYYFVVETSGVKGSLSPTLTLVPRELPPVCVSISCAAQSKNCGTLSDGCGETINCGTCDLPGDSCAGGGVTNVCGHSLPSCTPTSCAAEGKDCGTMSDGCGGTLNCGTCSGLGEACGASGEENVCGVISASPSVPSDSYMDEVSSFNPGPGSGFGQSNFPGVVLGPPHGNGAGAGGTDVLSLGVGGQITLRSDTPILNGPGPDFIVFENAFYVGGNPLSPFAEPGQVSVSQDGITFYSFPCDASNHVALFPGCAGVHPTLANPDTNMISPTDPAVAGGDAFDLQNVGLTWILYVRVADMGNAGGGGTAGFDLDAVSIVHQ